ncbi:MAG: Ig-like domain-containing protein, partial [Clostridia bacterium]
NWTYYGNYMNRTGMAATKDEAVCMVGADADAWTAFKIKTSKAGLYQASISYKNHVGAERATAYLLPGDVALTDIEETLATATPLRTFIYESGAAEKNARLGEVAVQGNTEYIIVLKSLKAGNDTALGIGTLTAAKFVFDGNEPGPETPVIASVTMSLPDKIAIGGKVLPKLSGILKSGLPADLSKGATFVYTSSNPDAATVDRTTGVVTAIAGGTTDISVTVTMGGADASTSAQITVITADGEVHYPGSENSVKYDFVSCLARNGEVVDPLTEYNPKKNTNWAFAKYFDGSAKKVKSYYGTLWILGGDPNTWAAFKIKAPKSGMYKASMTYREHSAAKSANIYLLPGTTAYDDIGTAIATATPAGKVDFITGKPTSRLQTAELGEV